jgi:tetraacyldisaccharide 4'-kinase
MNPLTGLYGTAIALRNVLFDRGVLRARRLEQPVVSVGNLSAGGTGKTPFVIALGELLTQRDIRFDVLSRGYGRKTRGVLVVDPQGSASDFGDEPLLIARKLRVPVVVGESRYQAGQMAERKFKTQLHLLDDGFQHRSLARDFDIVLMAPSDFKDRLLPSGRLREPLSSLRRANAIVLPQDFAADPPEVQETQSWRTQREILLSDIPPAPLVFCGIARPQQFFAQLRAAGVTPVKEIVFRDHHAYDKRDIQHLIIMRRELGAGGFLTTEKDAINLGPLQAGLEPLAIATLKLNLDRPAELVDTILARIGDRKPRS